MTDVMITSLISPPAKILIDVYVANGLAADYQAVNSANYAVSVREAGPPPKMFLDGTADLPLFTASGIDPATLAKLPFACRHYAAGVPDRAQVVQLFEECANDPYAVLMCPPLQDAIVRMRDWAAGRRDLNPYGDSLAGLS